MNFKKGSPESAGIPSGCLLHFLDRLQKKQVPMHSFLLMRHDTLIAEGYYAPYQKDTLHRMFSISKSFTSIAIGLLEAEGKLSLDDPIVSFSRQDSSKCTSVDCSHDDPGYAHDAHLPCRDDLQSRYEK